MAEPPLDMMYCPRCDRPYVGEGTPDTRALEKVKKHVSLKHPDHDPEWYETYPEGKGIFSGDKR